MNNIDAYAVICVRVFTLQIMYQWVSCRKTDYRNNLRDDRFPRTVETPCDPTIGCWPWSCWEEWRCCPLFILQYLESWEDCASHAPLDVWWWLPDAYKHIRSTDSTLISLRSMNGSVKLMPWHIPVEDG